MKQSTTEAVRLQVPCGASGYVPVLRAGCPGPAHMQALRLPLIWHTAFPVERAWPLATACAGEAEMVPAGRAHCLQALQSRA